jgi:hypothetical protein
MSPERGLIWMSTNDQKLFRSSPDGQRRPVGCKVFGPAARVGKKDRKQQLPQTA